MTKTRTSTRARRKGMRPVDVMNYQFDWVLKRRRRRAGPLAAFYRNDFKWTQKQSSLWIEGILRGYPCLPEIMLLAKDDGYAVLTANQALGASSSSRASGPRNGRSRPRRGGRRGDLRARGPAI